MALASHCGNYNNLSHYLFKGMTMEMYNMEYVLRKSLTWTSLPESRP